MKKIFPVIHVENLNQALEQTDIAMSAGSNGVFLINHSQSYLELYDLIKEVIKISRPSFLGANFLGATNFESLRLARDLELDGLWTDNIEVHSFSNWKSQLDKEKEFKDKYLSNMKYFAGVAFKYQPQLVDLETEIKSAMPYCEVLTTSGPGTAKEADLAKLAEIRKIAGNHLIAVASGVTPENIDMQLEFIDYVLVASGIADTWTTINKEKLDSLLNSRNEFNN